MLGCLQFPCKVIYQCKETKSWLKFGTDDTFFRKIPETEPQNSKTTTTEAFQCKT